MTQDQIKQVRDIIANDCMACGWYLTASGFTCAIGALALAAEDTSEMRNNLKDAGGRCIFRTDKYCIERIVKVLEGKFGLSLKQLEDIQDQNDKNKTPETRRAAILELPFLQLTETTNSESNNESNSTNNGPTNP